MDAIVYVPKSATTRIANSLESDVYTRLSHQANRQPRLCRRILA